MVGGNGIFDSRYHSGVTPLEKVRGEIDRYEHALFAFSAEERDGAIELVIQAKDPALGLHIYHAPIHPHDIEHPQFPWTFQHHLYDCLHDYVVEMFLRTPQFRDSQA